MNARRIRPVAGYLTFMAVHVAVSVAFIVVFRSAAGYRLMIVPLHLWMVGVLYLGLTVVAGLLTCVPAIRASRIGRYAVAMLFAVVFGALFALYGIDYVANRTWGANVNIRVIATYVPQFRSLINALPYPSYWFYLPSAGVIAVVLGIYLGLSRRIMAGLEELFLPGRPWSLFNGRRRALISGVVLVALLGGSLALIAYTFMWRGQFWKGEPIVSLLRPPFNPMFASDSRTIRVAQEAQDVRAVYPRNVSFDKKNVVIIMCDSLRASHMQVYGYERPTTPFLAKLAEDGRLRKVGFVASTCSETACGILTTLTSRNNVDLSYYNFKVYDLLQDQGYKTYYIASGDHTNFHAYRDVLGRGLNFFWDGGHTRRYTMNDDRAILDGLEQVPASQGVPAFFFFFLMSTHHIGVKLDEYQRYQPCKVSVGGESEREAIVNRYDNGIVQADAIIEKIFRALEEKGYLSNALVLILADHGEAIGEHGSYLHCMHLYQEEIGIPLLIYDDAAATYPNLEFATQVDAAPTIVDRLGLPIPSCWEGRSLLNPDVKTYSFHSTTSTRPSRAVLFRTDTALYKFIRADEGEHPQIVEELYELHSDPGERNNLLDTADPALLAQLRAQLDKTFGAKAGK